MKHALVILAVALAGACDLSSSRDANAQATGIGPIRRMAVLDGGICAGTGSSGDPFHCDLTVDETVGGVGTVASPLSLDEPVAEFTYMLFGDGSDGTFTFDGSTTFVSRQGVSIAPSGNVYTLTTATMDVFCHGCTINSGVTVDPAGFRFFDDATLTLNGKIARNGNAGSGVTGGASIAVANTFMNIGGAAGGNGGAGGAGASSTGGSTANTPQGSGTGIACANTGGTAGNPGADGGACRGGGGGSGSDGAASASGTVTVSALTGQNFRHMHDALAARVSKTSSTASGAGSGGGGGRGSSAPSKFGGGGGGGGGYLVVQARGITGSGSIEAKGGAGAGGETGGNTGGGGGGGGGVAVVLVSAGTCPTISVTGGSGGAKQGTGGNGGNGGIGISRCLVMRP